MDGITKEFAEAFGDSFKAPEDKPPEDDNNKSGDDTPPEDNKDDQNTPPQDNPGDDGTPPSDEDPASGNGDQSNQDNQPNNAQDQSAKMAHAFAQLRTENKQLGELVKGVAEVLGIENANDPEAVKQALQDKVLKAQAQREGVSPELLQRLKILEERDRVNTQKEIQRNTYLGFQKLKSSFGLDDKDLQTFAEELVAAGMNPFEQPVDVVKEYRDRHFEDLIKQAEERGAQQEAQRSSRAASHSSTPDRNRGGTSEEDTPKINTVSQLNAFFEERVPSSK